MPRPCGSAARPRDPAHERRMAGTIPGDLSPCQRQICLAPGYTDHPFGRRTVGRSGDQVPAQIGGSASILSGGAGHSASCHQWAWRYQPPTQSGGQAWRPASAGPRASKVRASVSAPGSDPARLDAPLAAIEDVHPQCGRELCALARVNMSGSREPSGRPTTASPAPWSPAHPPAAEGSCKWPAGACLRRSSEIRKSARRSKHQARCPGRFSPRPRDCAACCRGQRVPAFQRRSLWLDQASARRALAVPPRGSSDASTTAAMSSRCSPEPSVRSRRLPGAAA